MNKREKNVRQGQTRWQVVLYEPGAFAGYDDRYVAVVHRCFVTSVSGNTVRYTIDGHSYMMSGRKWFIDHTEASYKRAIGKARYHIEIADKMIDAE